MGDRTQELETVSLLLERVVLAGFSHELDLGRVEFEALALAGGLDEIALCASSFVDDLDKPVDDWRSRDVIEIYADQVASLEVLSGADRIRAVKVDETWQLLEPVATLP